MLDTMRKDPLLGPNEVAGRLSLPVKTVTRGSLRREIPWILVGRRYRVLLTAFESWLTSRHEETRHDR
jgi:hypothetical protein